MRSSISNSDKRTFVSFLAGFAMAFAAIHLISRLNSASVPGERELASMTTGHYPAARDGYSDHFVLYHGLEGTLAPLRKAEFLFLGTSRTQYTFSRENIAPLFNRLGIPYYVLGFVYSEQNVFPELVIQKHDLKPKWVLVECHQFFSGRMSNLATEILDKDTWQTWTAEIEAKAAHQWTTALASLFPRPLQPYNTWREPAIFRSRDDGTWLVPETIQSKIALPNAETHEPTEREITIARLFVEKMAARGAKVAFTLIPTGSYSPIHAQKLAQKVGVPFLYAEVADLFTLDHNHLHYDSSARFTTALLPQIERWIASPPPDKTL